MIAMKEEEIPDLNIFMVCEEPNLGAFSDMPDGFSIRNCRRDELDVWKAFPFDDPATASEHYQYMTHSFESIYGRREDLFFENTLFVCDANDRPAATCAHWKSYDAFNAIHWFKVLKDHEGKGIGRALLSVIMRRFSAGDYPVYLHTQPGSFRAIKLYSDFGFKLLSGEKFGTRLNGLDESLPILKRFIPEKHHHKLKVSPAPEAFLRILDAETSPQF